MKKITSLLALLVGLNFLAVQTGFSKPDKVRSYHEIVPASETLPAINTQSHAAPYGALRWEDPDGWEKTPASGMRLAGFQIDNAVCTIVSLSGNAGGLEANVKRWLGQVGITDMEDSEFKALLNQMTEVQAQDDIAFQVVDLTELSRGKSSSITAIGSLPEKTVFVKLTGPVATLSKLKKPYLALLESFNIGQASASEVAQAKPFSSPAPEAKKQSLTWDVPKQWKEISGSGMRIATFQPASSDEFECYISMLGGDGGGLERNVQWWSSQLGSKLEGDELVSFIDKQDRIRVNKVPFHVIDYGSMVSDQNGNSMMVAVGRLPSKTVFVKMTGTKKDLNSNRREFMKLVKSLKQP